MQDMLWFQHLWHPMGTRFLNELEWLNFGNTWIVVSADMPFYIYIMVKKKIPLTQSANIVIHIANTQASLVELLIGSDHCCPPVSTLEQRHDESTSATRAHSSGALEQKEFMVIHWGHQSLHMNKDMMNLSLPLGHTHQELGNIRSLW